MNLREAAATWNTPNTLDFMPPRSPEALERQFAGPRAGRTKVANLREEVDLWMTPMVPNGGRAVSAELVKSKGMTEAGEKRTVGLESQSRHWATPTTSEANGSGMHGTGSIDLRTSVQSWPTPAARDYRGENSEHHLANGSGRLHMDQLPNFVKFVFSPPPRTILAGEQSSMNCHTSPRRLNPAFACWLMGWPWWWTNPAPTSFAKSEMALYRSRMQQHLCCLLDGQELFEEAA